MRDELTPRELELLSSAFDFYIQQDRFPESKWLSRKLLMSPPQVSDNKRRLREKGFLRGTHGQIDFTHKAFDLLNSPEFTQRYRVVVRTHLPIIAEVSAGKGTQLDELALYVNDNDEFDYSGCDTVSIPDLNAGKDIVALKVKGDSMVKAGIYHGDFAIVERKENEPRINEIIVARYLPEFYNEEAEELIDPATLELKGPTLKRYKGAYINSMKRKLFRLGGLTAQEYHDPEEIVTRFIKPIGKVIGFYRAL